jgi:hypothetical protein
MAHKQEKKIQKKIVSLLKGEKKSTAVIDIRKS